MKDYLKPEVEYVDFVTEKITTGEFDGDVASNDGEDPRGQ